MRVRATASGNQHSNAIGQVELSCTPSGLALGLFGVGPYTEGYAVGALTRGTRFTVPYHCIRSARAYGDQLQLEFELAGFPHDRLTLTRFMAGPGVPPEELRRRRLILHLGALSFAALACLCAALLGPRLSPSGAAWSTLAYGLTAGAITLALGYAVDQSFFVRPPGEEETRLAFVRELSAYVPQLVSSEAPFTPPTRQNKLDFTKFIPRRASSVGAVAAATILTALVSSQRMFMEQSGAVTQRHLASADSTPFPEPTPPTFDRAPTTAPVAPQPLPQPKPTPARDASSAHSTASIERHCMCDRADSTLWKSPIPKLSALLIERRSIPTKTHARTQLEVAVINNSDTPMNEITLHVQFYENKGKKPVPTKERPLYFEGPLAPGHAIKWSAEARGDSYEILVPDFGNLGPNGDGAAPADAFVELLNANHRPVRLHAARILSYLGDPRARDAALHLKDAMRAAETPYLRRVLMATGDVRVCDIELTKASVPQLGVCVYNATEEQRGEIGLQLNSLSGSLDVQQPLADPPELRASEKTKVPGTLDAQSGVYLSVPVPKDFLVDKNSALEVIADRYDLLD